MYKLEIIQESERLNVFRTYRSKQLLVKVKSIRLMSLYLSERNERLQERYREMTLSINVKERDS